MPNVRIVTLGCAKNEVDSEEIAGVLVESGYELDATRTADVTVINTCGFLESAKRESIDAIKRAVAEKGSGRVVVAGCLAQRLGRQLELEAPGADAYVGVGHMADFGSIVGSLGDTQITELRAPHHKWAAVGTRARTGAPWSAYLKLSEGCDHRCTFCTIPSFRGPHASKPVERLLAEAEHLASTGALELNLIAQDVTQYGYDLYREFTLPRLLRELDGVDGIRWIRLLYFYPNRLTAEVIVAMAEFPKVLPYIDIPLQHAHPATLRRMKRPWDGDRYLRLFDKVRDAMPDVAIRTTFIVGFPGETEAEFEYLLDFVRQSQLDRVGAFMFSREQGTPAYDMPDQVPFKVKRERFDKLMRLQKPISLAKNRALVGRKLEVLIEDCEGGRSFRDAPEIDGKVYVADDIEPGQIALVEVTEAGEHDVAGRISPAGGKTCGRSIDCPSRHRSANDLH